MTTWLSTVNPATNHNFAKYGIAPGVINSTQTLYWFSNTISDDWICTKAGYIVGCYAAVQTSSTSGSITCVPYSGGAISSCQVVFTLSGTNTGNLYGFAYYPTGVALSIGTSYRTAAYFSGPSATTAIAMIVRYT